MRKKWLYVRILLGVLVVLLCVTDTSFAASDIEVTFGSDIDSTSFTPEMQKIYSGMGTVFRSIITIMTIAAGAMVVFGIEDGKKTVWQFMLGIGLAMNFGSALYELFSGTGVFQSVDSVIATHKGVNATTEILKNSNANGNDDILTEIMAVFSGTILYNGMPVLQAIALRMTLVLAAIEGGYKIAVELMSGDKVKFLVAMAFKVGFFCFLIMEWANIGQALSQFFQSAGFLAAGESGFSTVDPTSPDADKTFRPDSIWHNAVAFLTLALTGKADGDAGTGWGFANLVTEGILVSGSGILSGNFVAALIGPIVTLLIVLIIVGIMLLIAVELFVARIEFYTMMLLSVVFLPFGVTDRLSFLSNSAISLVFNSGAKMMVINFLQIMIVKMISAYLSKLTVNPFKDFSVIIQLLIMCILFLYITKKIPEMVSSFLSGSPALSGGGFRSQAKSVVRNTVSVASTAIGGAGVVAGALAGAGAASAAAKAKAGPTTRMSQLKNSVPGMLIRAGAQHALADNPFSRGFSRGAKGVIGQDGSLQRDNFNKSVQRLMGMTTGENNTPILERARTGKPSTTSTSGSSGGSGGADGGKHAAPGIAPTNFGGEKTKEKTVSNQKTETIVEKQGTAQTSANMSGMQQNITENKVSNKTTNINSSTTNNSASGSDQGSGKISELNDSRR